MKTVDTTRKDSFHATYEKVFIPFYGEFGDVCSIYPYFGFYTTQHNGQEFCPYNGRKICLRNYLYLGITNIRIQKEKAHIRLARQALRASLEMFWRRP